MKLHLLLILVVIVFTNPSNAQIGEINEEQIQQLEENRQTDSDEIKKVIYVPASHATLSALMWKYNLYDVDDEDILDNYLKTRNCQLYNKYYQDEFIWQNIRKGVQKEIQYFSGDYPERFQIVSFIRLGRYDFSELAFEIEDNFKLDSKGAFIFPFPNYRELGCGDKYSSKDFPLIMKFIPDNKFSLVNVPIPPDRADVLLDNISKYIYNNFKNERTIAMALNVKVNSIENYAGPDKRDPHLILYGQLDQVILYEDPDMTIPIWSKNFKELE